MKYKLKKPYPSGDKYYVAAEGDNHIYLQHDGTVKEWHKDLNKTTYFNSLEKAEKAIFAYEHGYKLKNILSYSDSDMLKVFTKKSWNTKEDGTSGTIFSWHSRFQAYAYCYLEDRMIKFKKPKSKEYSEVGVAVLESELKELNYKYNKKQTSVPYTTWEPATTNKGNKMSTRKFTKEDVLDALCNDTEVKVEDTKTDLENRKKYSIAVYGLDEDYETTLNIKSKKDATRFLQQPHNLGKTIVLSKEIEVSTTNIPLVTKKTK